MLYQGISRIKLIIICSFIFVLIAYSTYAFWDYLEGPSITISFPESGYSTSSPIITVRGTTEHAQFISLNDRPIYIDEKGAFSETLFLPVGLDIIQTYIRDRFGREETSVVYVLRTE
jgi:hypothetical protein